MTSLPLTVLKQTSLTITVGWTPPSGAVGYEFLRDGKRVSSSFDGAKSQVSFAIPDAQPHLFEVRALGLLASATVGVNQPSYLYSEDFSDGFAGVSQQKSSASRITTISGFAGYEHAARLICGPQDKGVAGASDLRTEIAFPRFSDYLGGGSLEGHDVYVRWYFKIASGFQFPTRWLDIGQFHAGASPNSPVFALQATPSGTFIVEQRGGSSQTPTTATILASGAVQYDHEYKIVVYRKFSTGPGGVTKVWLDRDTSQSPQVSMTGPTLFAGMESLPYMKVGMYGGSLTQDNVMSVAGIRWALTPDGI